MSSDARPFAALASDSPLAAYVERVWLGVPAAPNVGDGMQVRVPLTVLATQREAILDAMTLRYGGDAERHARALLSQWSKYYFALAVPAALVSALVLQRPLDMAPARCVLLLTDGMPEALYLPHDALGEMTDDPARRYASLIDEHLHSLVDQLASMTKIAPRVLWSNVGNLLDSLFEQCAAMPGAQRDAAWMFESRALFGADEPNPLRTPVRHVTPASKRLPVPFRARRVCCVRYEIPGEDQLCASCPLLLTMSDEKLALQECLR
ncbi:siderophore-iron reductase FhuF [Paraburkholderia phymatum]|uniref:Ferric iron reductase n=1 Tax=Paraburkholderia phymatum (strain DSM 17167 / CIP 108236 / LMG 21445 / STM815) TaxID=391038 RepID=B2JPH4_PARP8|nr:siderophore-iron reductase FhuF [Paraburkholderia phymatum]ACC73165.1 ferric iron reductase [Paraburkholderia phymatum STM815]